MSYISQTFPNLIITRSYRDTVCDYLRGKWSQRRNASEHLARAANATPRSAVNWLSGQAAPNGDTLISLMASDPDFETIILELVKERRCSGVTSLKSAGVVSGPAAT